jgi:hypothetical protein
MKPILLLMLFASACTYVRTVRAIQPALTADTPSIWVEVQTNKEEANGIYRCVDSEDDKQPVCWKAEMRR